MKLTALLTALARFRGSFHTKREGKKGGEVMTEEEGLGLAVI